MNATFGQIIRFGLVGSISNSLIFLLYLTVTEAGLEYKLAMTLLYVLAVLQTFVFNSKWSFRHAGPYGRSFIRYCIAYIGGYIINILGLLILVDGFGFAHQVVQGCMIATLACIFFILQKFWIFQSTTPIQSN